MRCAKCKDPLPPDGDFITCGGCKIKLHFKCSSIRETTWRNMSTTNKNNWRCGECRGQAQVNPCEILSDVESKEDIEQDIKQIILELKNEVSVLKNSIDFMSNKYDDTVIELKTNNDLLRSLTSEVRQLKSQNAEKDQIIDDLKTKVYEMEQNNSVRNVEICEVIPCKNENLKEVACKIAKELNIELSCDNIEDIYRVPLKNKTKTSPIIVKLTTLAKRNELLQHRHTKDMQWNKGTDGHIKKIFINENLTPYHRRMLWLAKEKAKTASWKYVWTKNGKILARKNDNDNVVRVSKEADLQRIK